MTGMNRLGTLWLSSAAAALGLFVLQGGFGLAGDEAIGKGLYWAICVIAFSAGFAANASEARRKAGFAALGAVLVLAAWLGFLSPVARASAEGMGLLAVALTGVFAGVRSGVLHARAIRSLRGAIGVEVLLGLAALLFGEWLSGPSPASGPWGSALSLWGYALVQSLYACVPKIFLTRGDREARPVDPFDAAHARLVELLGE